VKAHADVRIANAHAVETAMSVTDMLAASAGAAYARASGMKVSPALPPASGTSQKLPSIVPSGTSLA
jgi:hypothetical protein